MKKDNILWRHFEDSLCRSLLKTGFSYFHKQNLLFILNQISFGGLNLVQISWIDLKRLMAV